MSPALEIPVKPQLPWAKVAWFGLLILVCYAPVLKALVSQWANDEDMSHGFFVPVIAGFIVWQKRDELAAMTPKPNWWGFAVVVLGCLQLLVGTLGVELFTARSSLVVTLIGAVWMMGGTQIVKKLAFPLFLLFLMVPIPTVVYNQITFPLQGVASHFAESSLDLLNIPVLRDGNILTLPPDQRLEVVEACSGIRSLLTLTFLALVYGYFFEKRTWIRIVLFLSTIPVAIVANGSRITITGILSQIKPEYSQGFFHEATGLFLFMADFVILLLIHRVLVRIAKFKEARQIAA